jgi:hypothetical protein
MADSRNVLQIVIEAVNRTAPGFAGAAKSVANLTKQFPVLSAAAGLALNHIVGQMGQLASQTVAAYLEVVKIGDALDDMSTRIKIGADEISRWSYVMETSGGTAADFERNVTKLRKEMRAFSDGSKESARRFDELGVSALDASGNLRPVEDVLIDISRALQGAGDESKKMAAANELVGRGPQAILGALKEGPEELQRKLRLVSAVNGEMSQEFAKSSALVADSQTLLKFAWRGLKADVAGAINWDVAIATNKLAALVAIAGGHYDELKRLHEDTKARLADSIFPDPSKLTAGARRMQTAIEGLQREALVKIAKTFNVATTESIFNPDTLKFVDVPRTAEAIARDLGKAREDAIRQARREAEREAAKAEAEAKRDEERIRRQQQRGLKITGRPDPKPQVQGPPEPVKTAKTDIETLRESIADLAKFTAEDFANIAFSIGDTFGTIVGDIGAQMLGLREGPLMIGRAFKSMAAGIISDLARIIARMLVARALMSIFGGGSFLGGVGKALAGGSGGMTVPTASAGYSVPGSGTSGLFPAVILPGSPGLDRTPVLAQGGEMLIPRQRVNAAEKMIGRFQSSPRKPARSGSGRQSLTLNVQANRPFRTTEQIELRQSVLDGIKRGERYGS